METFRKAIELDPGQEWREWSLSTTLQAGRRYAEAIALERRLIARDPELLYGHFTLVRTIFKATGSIREADALLARLTPAELSSRRGIDERWRWAALNGDYTEWKRLHVLRNEPRESEEETRGTVAIVAAIVMATHGDRATAQASVASVVDHLKATLKEQPTNATLWSNLGMASALLGDSDEAVRCARKAVELLPESMDAAEGSRRSRDLAVVYAWTGHASLAIAELDRLLKVPSIFNYQNSVHTLRVDPAFSPLRGHSDFEALLADPNNIAPLF